MHKAKPARINLIVATLRPSRDFLTARCCLTVNNLSNSSNNIINHNKQLPQQTRLNPSPLTTTATTTTTALYYHTRQNLFALALARLFNVVTWLSINISLIFLGPPLQHWRCVESTIAKQRQLLEMRRKHNCQTATIDKQISSGVVVITTILVTATTTTATTTATTQQQQPQQ